MCHIKSRNSVMLEIKKKYFCPNMAYFNPIKVFIGLLCLAMAGLAHGQELNCQIDIVSPKVQMTNKEALIGKLKTGIENFLSATKWTNDKYKPEERINVSIVFTIDEITNQTNFQGSMQLVSSRPVYGSGYNSTMLRVYDKNVDFTFREFEPLQYLDGAFTNNLTQVLAFYAYMVLGMDFDSYAEYGGTQYLTKALEVANTAQASEYGGWSATEKGRDNRYWLVFQMMDERFKPLRQTLYSYHRLGFDTFTENMQAGRTLVLEALERLLKVHKNSPNSYLLQVFMEAKRLEIINLFKNANQTEKNRLITLVESIDIANVSKYRTGINI